MLNDSAPSDPGHDLLNRRAFISRMGMALGGVALASALLSQVATAREKDADEFAAQRYIIVDYLKAVGQADTETMAPFYASTVTVLAGSTLLDPKYGGLAENTERNVTVKRGDLLKAYDKAIAAFGGAEDWKDRRKDHHKKEVRLFPLQEGHVERLKKEGVDLKVGDTVAIVNPTGDEMTFILRKGDDESWTIVAEHWD